MFLAALANRKRINPLGELAVGGFFITINPFKEMAAALSTKARWCLASPDISLK
jgi:hypothetical protein